jgi:tetratricopeptide (TPR) repeat protein
MNGREREVHPLDEEMRLDKELMEARKERDRERQRLIEKKIVKLYVSQAEYFKMAEKPDPSIAKKYLEKAVRIQADHPVANYRLAYLYYRKREYTKAILHFGKALDGSETEGLNDTQTLLANMFMVNCGIRIAKESILEVQSIEENLYSNLEKDRIEKYRKEILVLDEDVFERMFYKKIEDGIASRINEDEFISYQPMGKQILLKISDQGREIIFPGGLKYSLSPVAFNIFHALLTTSEFLTYRDLKQKSELEVNEDNIRQMISRYSRNIPVWNEYFQSANVVNPETSRQVAAYKLAEGVRSCILSRGDEELPGDYELGMKIV